MERIVIALLLIAILFCQWTIWQQRKTIGLLKEMIRIAERRSQ